MADWGRLCDYERRFTYPDSGDERLGLEMLESLRRLQQAWVTDAQEVLGRVRRLSNAGAFPQIELLEDTIGSALARLSLSPQQIAGARRQMMAGQTIPARELRNELQARLHA